MHTVLTPLPLKQKCKFYKKNTNTETSKNTVDATAYAYLSKWNSIDDATFLGALLQQNIVPRFAEKAFSANGNFF